MSGEITELCGTVERVIFKSEENNFSVISLRVSSSQAVTLKGYLPDIHQGAQITCKGTWIFHKKFGNQFQAEECSVELPSSASGIQKYLSSGLVKGIGPKFAERLVKAFGEKTLEVIDKEPRRLLEVSGVGPARVEAIVNAWQDQKEVAAVMVFLRSKGVSAAFAIKIFKTYGHQAIEKMQENPYQLVDDIWGIGFKTADQIALKLGLDIDSLDRIKAAIHFVLTDATSNGHLYCEVEECKKKVAELLELDATEVMQRIKKALNSLYQQKKMILVMHDEQYFVSLPQFYYSEKAIALKIEELLKAPSYCADINLNELYQSLRYPDKAGVMMNDDQQRGIISCFQHKVAIVTGGPGTGKTTMIRRLLDLFEQHKIAFKLAAPTGRAAKRMFESTGRSTETIHRLLEFSPAIMNFSRNETNALDCKVLIVDEASMIDTFLMNSLLKALPIRATLILIGDVDQLPSVGAGNVLNDLIETNKISTIRLKQIFRQAQDSLIVVNAHRVNEGSFPVAVLPGAQRDFLYIKEPEPENIFSLLSHIYKKKLIQRGIAPEEAMVLTPMNRGVVGATRINQELQMILNPVQDERNSMTQFGRLFKVADRVMQVRNNYDKFVFNGDIGVIESIDKVNQKTVVRFNERDVEYDFAEMNELSLAYAISIHKSQGSEFKAVIIPLFMQHFVLLQRNLIYTAITRAKKLCIMIGQPKAIAMGIKNDKGVDRITFLKEQMTGEIQLR